jgi:hypothetical protein
MFKHLAGKDKIEARISIGQIDPIEGSEIAVLARPGSYLRRIRDIYAEPQYLIVDRIEEILGIAFAAVEIENLCLAAPLAKRGAREMIRRDLFRVILGKDRPE